MIKKILISIITLFCLTLSCYSVTEQEVNQHIKSLSRTIVLDNGMTFDINPSVENDRLYVSVAVSHGWARLNDGEYYDIHLVDANGNDVLYMLFPDHDFSWDSNDIHRAKKFLSINEIYYDDLMQGVKFKMRYPAWVEDI